MRQTSRAVALLLAVESANAVYTLNIPAPTAGIAFSDTVFLPAINAASAPTNTLQLNSRTAGYVNKVTTKDPQAGIAWTTLVTNKAKFAASAAATAAITITGASGCMACLNKDGVWCSSTYSYVSTTAQFQQDILTADHNSLIKPGTNPLSITGAALDNGSCCDSNTNFNNFAWTQIQRNTAVVHTVHSDTQSQDAAGLALTNSSCVAITNTVTGATTANVAFGASEIDATTVAYSGWWCSNGLYKNVTANGTVVLNAQQLIPQGVNKRMELAQVGCPQGKAECGNEATLAIELTSGAATRTVTMPATGITTSNKCTWVTHSVIAAPNFKFGLSAGSKGLSGTNWEIHAMEYTTDAATTFSTATGSLVQGLYTTGFVTGNEALSLSMTPLFTMPANQYATLRTWYGEGVLSNDLVSGQSAAWLSAGQAYINVLDATSLQLLGVKSQLYGNVANVPVSNNIDQSATSSTATGNFNFGKYNNTVFDLRAMRYFPAKVAQTQHAAGTTAAAAYATALSSYTTAKTTWDAYVAILEKNAKQDAFAALFSPPKAPTVPPLPNKPWLPAAYSGYTRATALDVMSFKGNVASLLPLAAASPTASQFWTSLAAAQTVGGWGSFTATILRYRNGWGKSFGTIGYDGSTDQMGDVWNYKWTCAAASTVATAVSATSQCAPTYTTASAGVAATATSTTAANAVKMISAVSLWSTGNTATTPLAQTFATAQNGFKITWTSGAWTSGVVGLTPIAAPTAAVAAKSLTGIAGAQALVATSAAALAVAAALY